jgi:hypothetical protein
MEIKTEIMGTAPMPGSSIVCVLVEVGDELMTISVIVPNDVSDEQKKVLALAEPRALLANLVISLSRFKRQAIAAGRVVPCRFEELDGL